MWRFPALAVVLACACGACAQTCQPAPGTGVRGEEAPDGAADGGPAAGLQAPETGSPIRLIGRFDPPTVPRLPDGGHGSVRYAWSGSTIQARFTGPSLAMRLRAAPLAPHAVWVDGKRVMFDEKTTAYAVRIDARPPFTVEVSAEQERYELASGLEPHVPHDVQIVREAEAFAGVHELLGLDLGSGGTFLPSRPRPRRIEIVGDSISCGYGVLGESARCPFTYATERATAAYGARLGQMLDADVTTVCWSGRGVLRNYDGSTSGTMRELFELAIPTVPTARWSFAAAPPPDAVIVALGTNDFLGGGGKPLDLAAFEDAYATLARRIREVYPEAWLFATTSPMLAHEPVPAGPGPVDDLARASLERVVTRRVAEGDRRIELIPVPNQAPRWGCDGHPNSDMNAGIADRIAAVVRARLHL